MTTAAVSYALGKLDMLLNMGFKLSNVNDDIKLLQLELRIIKGFLKDAYSKRNRKEGVKQWVNEVRDVAYRIEDAIDTFLVDIEENDQRSKLVRVVNKSLKVKKLLKLLDEIKEIKKSLDIISQTKTQLGITDSGASSEENDQVPFLFRPSRPDEIEDSEIVGLDSDKHRIIKHLLNDDIKRRTVLSIVGIGGLGKTTLAQKIYRSGELMDQFNCSIWLSISQKFNVSNLLRDILYQVEPDMRHKQPAIADNDLIRELQESLIARRYFIVLDDVWTIDLWESLKKALPENNNACRVLITSRFLDVAKVADSSLEPYKLRCLDDNDSLALLSKKVFPYGLPGRCSQFPVGQTSNEINSLYPADLIEVAQELAKKCGGLPLALIVLGGILKTRDPTCSAWKNVSNNLDWHDENTKQCSQVLLMSYVDLPYYLKPCFLYFASFPEDHKISTKHITRMWIAEGLISKDGSETLEGRAEELLQELIQRCLVEVERKSWSGYSKQCKMHDLIRDIAIHEAEEENFFTVISKMDECNHPTAGKVRRATLQYTDPENFVVHSTNIRSIISFRQHISNFGGFRLLRVLTIEKVNMRESKIAHIGWLEGLIHLRYLGFRYCQWLEGFEQNPFSSLKNLETLDCKGTDFICLNLHYIWEIATLRHVIIEKTIWQPVPSKITRDHLRNIQTLKCVTLEHFPNLEYNINLRTIGIIVGERCGYDIVQQRWKTLKDLLKHTNHLVSLFVDLKRAGVLPMLSEGTSNLPCHKTIECLHLHGKWANNMCVLSIGMLPEKLTKFTLHRSKLEEDPMPILERLKCLRILRLWGHSFVGTNLTCTGGGFPSLQKLELNGLPSLRYWDIQRKAMPKLYKLKLKRCTELVELPNLQNVPALKDLTLCKYNRGTTADDYKYEHVRYVCIE